jgi:hypothetical protein
MPLALQGVQQLKGVCPSLCPLTLHNIRADHAKHFSNTPQALTKQNLPDSMLLVLQACSS